MLSSTYHDEKLISIAASENSLTLQIYSESKTSTIQLNDLVKLRATDFEEGNIINIVQIFDAHNAPTGEATYRSLIKYAYGISNDDLKKNPKLSSFLNNKIREYEKGSLLILEVEPSYGCYLVAIGRTISEAVTST
ncbi:hypothetical protein NUH87_01765 [Pseudomonas batumici]|uniref:hypothetical protein n=1 Tax=Pseudomonas batumici TaxID=226910 RepID=UPI0030CFADAB